MKSINLGEFYLTVPDNWDSEVDGNIVSLFDRYNGFGALQFSFYSVSNIDSIDLRKELQEYLLDKHGNIDVDLINDYAYFDVTIDGIYWRYWLLKAIKNIVFISYNCDPVDIDKEKIIINNIINSMLPQPG